MSYEEDIVIDETAIDVELLDQSRRMLDYCRIAAAAHRTLDLAKENIKFVRAALAQQIRMRPKEFGIEVGPRGLTEAMIDDALQLQDEYRKVCRAHIDAKFECDVADGVVRAFEHRKGSLENLVRLHGQSYFAGPRMPHDLSEERTRREQAVHRHIRMSGGEE